MVLPCKLLCSHGGIQSTNLGSAALGLGTQFSDDDCAKVTVISQVCALVVDR